MLTEKKKLIFLKKLFPILIISICLLMSIGYATVNDVFLNVEGEAVAMIPEGIYVTDIIYQESNAVDFSNSNINVVNDTILNHKIILSTTDSNSYIKYKIEIFNGYDYDWEFKGVSFDEQFYDNSDITYTLDDTIHVGDLVKSHEYVSLYVTFKYKDGIIPSELNNVLNAHINYEFIPCAILMATSETDTRAFRAADYKEDIVNITFEDEINIPDNAFESWDIGVSQTGDVIAFVVENEQTQGHWDLYIQSNTQLYGNKDMSYWFAYLKNVDSLNGISLLNISNTTNMKSMFENLGYSSRSLTLDLGDKFDTSNVTNMSDMFDETGYSSLDFTLDLGDKFDTSNVTNMDDMFIRMGYNSTVLKLDLKDKFDTSNVTTMGWMFKELGEYSTVFTLDLGDKFDTSKVTNMISMFYRTGVRSQNFTLDLGNKFDTSNVKNMNYMFYETGYTNPMFTLDVSGFDTSKVLNMQYMFYNTGRNSTTFTLDVRNFDTSQVTDMSSMFFCTGYSNTTFTLDVSGFDTSSVTNMESMFDNTGYSSTTFTLDVSKFDTSNVTNMIDMFQFAGYSSSIFNLDVSHFDTSKVTNMSYMFFRAGYNSKVFTLDVSNFDTSKVTDMSYMFFCTGYSNTTFTLDVSNFDTSSVTNMESMFDNTGYNSTVFTVDVSHFDTSNVTNMIDMFQFTGYYSSVFITDITIKNPNTELYSRMFDNVATRSGSKITVNYTNETSDLVDQMILTKSENSNVVKGYNVDVPITFTIDGTTYNAYEGMTWGQWVDSEFNVDTNWKIVYSNDVYYMNYGSDVSVLETTLYYNVTPQRRDYVINPEGEYFKGYHEVGGGAN